MVVVKSKSTISELYISGLIVLMYNRFIQSAYPCSIMADTFDFDVNELVEIDFTVKHTFSKDKKTLNTILSASLFQKMANRPFSMTVSVEGTFLVMLRTN